MICVEHLVVRVRRPVPAVLGVAQGWGRAAIDIVLPHARALKGGGARPLRSTVARRLNTSILSEIQRCENVRR